MSTNALEKFNPAQLAKILGREEIAVVNDAFAGGIQSGDFLPQISIRGNRFRLKIKGEETVLKDNSIEVYLVTARSNVSKTFYADGYSAGEAKAPDCSSADGVYPDANVENPVSPTCQTCPNNAWGSKISKATGKRSKACSDYKLVVLALTASPDTAFALRIPAASLKPFASYIGKLNLAGVPANTARTRITLGDTEFPSLEFEFVGTVDTREDYETLTELADSSDVLNAIKIQARNEPATTHAAQQPIAVPAPEPAPEPEPEQTAAESDSASLADLLGKPKTAAKSKAKVKPEPAPEPEPAPVSDEEGDGITSLDQLLATLKK